jgi:hypothetical protein
MDGFFLIEERTQIQCPRKETTDLSQVNLQYFKHSLGNVYVYILQLGIWVRIGRKLSLFIVEKGALNTNKKKAKENCQPTHETRN